MRFFNFIKTLLGIKKDECCTVEQVDPANSTETPIKIQDLGSTVVEPVEKAEVEKMSERLKDVTTSKPLTKIEPVEEKTISVKEIKARKKSVKTKSETSTPVEKPKVKKAKKPKKD